MSSDDPDMGRAQAVPEDHSEADLVDAARGGDHAAWEALYRSVYPGLRAFMSRRVGAAHVEDAVSETMTRAVAGIDRFQLGPVGFAGWVYGIGRRVAADHYRRAGRQARQEAAAVRSIDPDGPAPLDAVLDGEDRDAMRTAFARLSLDERELLELRVVGGLSAEDVAAALGKRAGAVRTAQYRALAHLRRILEAEGAEDA
jgi:RNA polymerase sigma-70 factor, ECF subfamily